MHVEDNPCDVPRCRCDRWDSRSLAGGSDEQQLSVDDTPAPGDCLESDALAALQALTGDPDAAFRDGQLEAIEGMVNGERLLVVEPTGWGKSAVYFIATKLRRERGSGPTILISPLLALMGNQVDAARRLPIRAAEWNTNTVDEWANMQNDLREGTIDLLLVSPERLSRPDFMSEVIPSIDGGIGGLVVDEAHCISDWGHDFRPDYRRIRDVVRILPQSIPVLATTATANNRVVRDVEDQIGAAGTIRGHLDRRNLSLQVMPLMSKPQRMAWIAETVSSRSGTGIVYALTVPEAHRLADWLRSVDINAAVYTGRDRTAERAAVLRQLDDGDIDVVVATSALGMGYDNPHLSYIIHYQSPSSIVTYYQQVGRAGRVGQEALGILLQGPEDARIQNYFINAAFPLEREARDLLNYVDRCDGVHLVDIEGELNLSQSRIKSILKLLSVEGAVVKRDDNRWYATAIDWAYDHERVAAVTGLRRREQIEMKEYCETSACLMQYLRKALDDRSAQECGRCSNCTGMSVPKRVDPDLERKAGRFISERILELAPRAQYPNGRWIPSSRRVESGRALGLWSDEGWADLVRKGKDDLAFDRELALRLAAVYERWRPEPRPEWITYVPSLRHPRHVPELAGEVGRLVGLPVLDTLRQTSARVSQRDLMNSAMQAANVTGHFDIVEEPPATPGLLIDDIAQSRWTIAGLGALLRDHGAGRIYPLVLVKTQ